MQLMSAPEDWLPWAVRNGRLDAPFTHDGVSVGQLLRRAEQLTQIAQGRNAILCVASADRVEVASALLAALSGKLQLLLPHALTPQALPTLYKERAFDFWLGPAEWAGQVPGSWIEPFANADETSSASFAIANPNEPSITLFTGGSTGRSKLWSKTATQLLGEAAMHVAALRFDPSDRFVATVPPNHIYGLLFSVLAPLLSGAAVERVSPMFPREVADTLAKRQATVFVSAPVHLRAIASVPWQGSHVRQVLSSGAPLDPGDAAAFHAGSRLWPWELYGSTETGGVATRSQGDEQPAWSALPDVSWRIDDGRLAVRSSYLSNELPRDSEGYFLTADRAECLDSDPTRFELRGRVDGVVKVGGCRVDLKEVEDRLRELEGVTDAVVVARPSHSGRGFELRAIVQSARVGAEILDEVRRRLPTPAWPRSVVCVASIPRTPSGKLDRERVDALVDELRD